MCSGRARATTVPSRTAPEEVRLGLDRRRAGRTRRQVQEGAHTTCGVGERHEHASVQDAGRRAQLRRPVERRVDLVRVAERPDPQGRAEWHLGVDDLGDLKAFRWTRARADPTLPRFPSSSERRCP
jgi:hypothetical protein